MPAGTPLTETQKRRIRALHKKGLGRNAIAREVGVSLAAVTKVCAAAGLAFDRAATKVAVEARAIDMRARRQAIVQRLYGRAETVMTRLEADTYRYTISVVGQGVEHVEDTDPPAQDERNLGSAIAGYLQAAARLEQIDAASNTAEVHGVLDTLAAGFAAAAAGYTPTADDLDP